MLDLQYLCDHRDEVISNCQNRRVKVDLSQLLPLRDRRSEMIQREDGARHAQKETSALIPKTKDPGEKQALIARGKELREQIGQYEQERKQVEEQLRELQLAVPNKTHPAAPSGGEADSVVARSWGEIPQFDFKPLDHVDLAARNNLIDFEAGTRVAGHGFYYLKNEAALLELALVQYAAQQAIAHGFTLYTTPDMARDEVLYGTGYAPRGDETQIYSIAGTDLSLVATAEITLGGAYKDHIFEQGQLPLRIAGISHCFRTEAGAHGRATRGIYRVHQFTKVELFAFTAGNTAASDAMHAEIVAIEEEIFQGLGIPYRVLDIAAGDLGGSAYRKFDLEAWMPGRDAYGEVTSASNCTDYQARRLAIRSRQSERKGTEFVHTLNGTAVAVTRTLIALLENYQQADGSILIPPVLQPWVGKAKIGGEPAAESGNAVE